MNLVSTHRRALRRLAGAAGLATAALLASCGGGDLENAFSPSRIVSFGDEASAIVTGSNNIGAKYTLNYLDTSTAGATVDCTRYPNWTQYLANSYNLPFPQCTTGSAPSKMYAAIGARVSEVTDQITTHLASDSFSRNDLVTIMVGTNDILEQYSLYAANSQDLATAEATLTARAQATAAQVQRVVAAGGKVLVSTVPNQGLTPWGVADAQRSADLGTLSSTYNNALRTALVDESGRNVGLILSDEIVRLDATYPGSYGLNNVVNPMCATSDTASLPNCTNATLNSGADPSTWLWAGDYMLGPVANSQIGVQAYDRATNNPF